MHLDEERLQRVFDGELSPAEARAAGEHLAACDECRGRFAALEREAEAVGRLLGRLDRPAPRVDSGAISRRAESRRSRPLQWAAAAAVVLGIAGVAYAIPGSPVPGWIASAVEWVGGRGKPVSPGNAPGAPTEVASGIAVSPGERFVIEFRGTTATEQVLVSLDSGADVQVRAPHGAATFTVGEGILIVLGRILGATYDVRIPVAAPRIEIRAGGTRIFLKEGRHVTTVVGKSYPYLLSLDPHTP